jgi:fructose-1,6-bisphosphatase/inositol monophosphatase family enzyme
VSLGDDAAFARSLAERAGELLLERYERVETIDYKSARDVVTEVDHLSEALLMEAIRQRSPGDGILAEESGAHHGPGASPAGTGARKGATTGAGHGATAVAHGASNGTAPSSGASSTNGSAAPAPAGVAGSETAAARALAHGRTWVLDPLDGTVNYANGIPYFCVSVALVEDGRPVVGVIRDPMRAETYWATAEGPAMLGDREVHASRKEALSDYVVSLALGGRAVTTRARAVRRVVRASRNTGSAALALAYVANGRFDAFLQTGGMSAWDVAAAGLIAERAGAVVSDASGGPWFDVDRATRAFGIVAAPPAHHAELVRLSTEAAR